jgi:hypothetical protein
MEDQPEVLMTLFIQEMLRRGYLASGQFYSTFAHTPEMVQGYLASVHEVFQLIASGIKQGQCAELLQGPVKHTGFKRLN